MIADDALDQTGHSFGYRGEAEHAFLQVVEEGDAAIARYRFIFIGYEVAHRYRRACLEGS